MVRVNTVQQGKDLILSRIAAGFSVADALTEINRSRGTYERWRTNDPAWAEQVTRLLKVKKKGAASKSHPDTTIDLVDFRKVYFNRDTPPHHQTIINALRRARPDSITVVLAFPEAAKSSLLVDYACWRIGNDPDTRICVISEGQDLSRKLLGQVTARMTDRSQFAPFIGAYGPFKAVDRDQNRPWTADYFRVVKASADEKEPTMEARGAGSAIYGGRYDLMLFDDIQSDRNLDATPKLLRYIRQTALTRAAKGSGKTVFVGSRVGDNDIYQVMEDEGMVDKQIIIPALDRWVDRDDHYEIIRGRVVANPECEAKPTWPEWWSLQALAERRRKVGEDVWARTYMQRHHRYEGQTFTPIILDQAKNPAREYRKPVGTGMLISIDPALESGRCAFMAAGYNTTQLMVVETISRNDIYRGEDIINQIHDLVVRYRPEAVIVETNNYQKTLVRDDRLLALADRYRFDIVEHHTGRNRNDPVMGVAMMSAAFADNEIDLPFADDQSRENTNQLITELLKWKPVRGSKLKMDTVMALWFLWREWTDRRHHTGWTIPRRERPTWMRDAV
jgi:hypothetical protein